MIVSCDITLGDSLNPSDQILLDAHDADLKILYVLDQEDNVQRRGLLLIYDLLSNNGTSAKLARRLCVKLDNHNKGFSKTSRGKPCVPCPVIVSLDDLSLHKRYESLNCLMSDASMGCVAGEWDDVDDDRSVTASVNKESPNRRQFLFARIISISHPARLRDSSNGPT